jgi:hypothetical protein
MILRKASLPLSIGRKFARTAEAAKGSLKQAAGRLTGSRRLRAGAAGPATGPNDGGTGGEMLSAAGCRAAPICRAGQICHGLRRRSWASSDGSFSAWPQACSLIC